MEHKEKKYVVLPGQEEGEQMEFDMDQMKEGNVQTTVRDEYEQMQFQVNSFYEEVSRERYSSAKGGASKPNMQENHSVINQKRYDQAQQFYKQAFDQSYQDGYYQGYQECYGKVYEQAYQQAYKQAFDQANAQKKSAISELDAKIESIRLATTINKDRIDSRVQEPDVKVEPGEQVTLQSEVQTQDEIILPKLKNNEIKVEPSDIKSSPIEVAQESVVEEKEIVHEEKEIVQESKQDATEIKEVMGIKPVEELHPERVSLQELAREEYREDVRLYAGKWNKSYVRKFSKMNETKQVLNWNFPAFLFGPLWYAFRKMPLMSISLLIGMVLILSAENGLVLSGILVILTGALSDKIYKSHMDRLLDAKSLMGDESQATHRKLRGGVSILYPLTLIVLALGAGIYIKEVLIFKSDFLKGIYDNLVNLYHTYL